MSVVIWSSRVFTVLSGVWVLSLFTHSCVCHISVLQKTTPQYWTAEYLKFEVNNCDKTGFMKHINITKQISTTALETILRSVVPRFADTGKGKGTWYSASSWTITSESVRYGICFKRISQFYLHTDTFIRNRNESYLPLPSHMILVYRPRSDGRLSWPGWLVT